MLSVHAISRDIIPESNFSYTPNGSLKQIVWMCVNLIYYTSRRAGLWPRFCHCPRDGCPGSALLQVWPTRRDPCLGLNNLTDGEEAKDTWCHHSESHGCLTNSRARICLECKGGEFLEIQIKAALICISMCHHPGIKSSSTDRGNLQLYNLLPHGF